MKKLFEVVCEVCKVTLLCAILLLSGVRVMAQKVSVKSNVAYLATTTPNLGVEVRLADHWSLSASGSYNPFLFPQWEDDSGNLYNPKLIHWTVAPEVKYWFCRAYERSFVGLHGIYGAFNVGGIPFIDKLKETRYDGYAYGGGISYGYEWAIGGRWGLELSAGVGYLHLVYDKCDAFVCGLGQGAFERDYFGPTKFAVTISYYLH